MGAHAPGRVEGDAGHDEPDRATHWRAGRAAVEIASAPMFSETRLRE